MYTQCPISGYTLGNRVCNNKAMTSPKILSFCLLATKLHSSTTERYYLTSSTYR